MESPFYLCGFRLVTFQGKELPAEGSVSRVPLGLGHTP